MADHVTNEQQPEKSRGAPSAMQKVKNTSQMVSKRDVHQFWTESARDFFNDRKTGIDISRRQDSYWRFLDMWEKEIVRANVTDGLILDLGAGTGRITQYLRSQGKTVVAVDFVFEALCAIKAGPGFCPRVNMDISILGFKDATFESVFACRVLQSLPTPAEKQATIREISRILKPGGRLILTEGNPLRVRFVPVPYNFYIPIKEWESYLLMSGFCVESVWGIPFLTGVKVLDTVTRGRSCNWMAPARLANGLDRVFGRTLLRKLSLQHDIIASKLSSNRSAAAFSVVTPENVYSLFCCPVTKQAVRPVAQPLIGKVNARIKEKTLRSRSGRIIELPVDGGLVREDGEILYPIRSDIPILISEEGIDVSALGAGSEAA